jgi:hypothetical protein
MAPLGFDLNEPPPEGPAHGLNYNFVWDDGNNGAASFQRFSLFCAEYDIR